MGNDRVKGSDVYAKAWTGTRHEIETASYLIMLGARPNNIIHLDRTSPIQLNDVTDLQMNETDELLYGIRDEFGIDVYSIFENEKNFIGEALLLGFLGACALDFGKKLVGAEQAGKYSRHYITEFVSELRGNPGKEPSKELSEQQRAKLEALLRVASDPGGELATAATDELYNELTKLNLTPNRARKHAKAVAALFQKLFRKRQG